MSSQVTTVKLQIYFNFLFKLTNFVEHNLIAAYEHLGKQNSKILAICLNIIRQQDFPFNNIYLKSK